MGIQSSIVEINAIANWEWTFVGDIGKTKGESR